METIYEVGVRGERTRTKETREGVVWFSHPWGWLCNRKASEEWFSDLSLSNSNMLSFAEMKTMEGVNLARDEERSWLWA